MSDVLPFVFSFPEDGKKKPTYNGACIYLICSLRGKPYVGQAKKFWRRMSSHKSNGKLAWINHAKYQEGKHAKVAAISFAINKHGWENMEIIILEKYVVWDQQLLDSREQYLIRFYDSFKNGYNSNEGGNRCKAHPCSEETRAKLMGHTHTPTKPVTSCEIKEEYADGTQLVKFVPYASATEAERQTGVHQGNISACCNKKNKSAGNRFWHFTKEGDLEGTRRVDRIGDMPMLGSEQRKRTVISKSHGGKKQQHEGVNAAGRTLSKLTKKKFNPGTITMCCQGKRTHHHGYTFCYASDEAESDSEETPAAPTKKRKMF